LLQPSADVDDQELWLAQPALDEIVENGAPRLAGFAAHILGSQQRFLTVLAYAAHDRCGLSVEPDPHHGAIQDQADDRRLGERARIPRNSS
jgi:hypothetical protein